MLIVVYNSRDLIILIILLRVLGLNSDSFIFSVVRKAELESFSSLCVRLRTQGSNHLPIIQTVGNIFESKASSNNITEVPTNPNSTSLALVSQLIPLPDNAASHNLVNVGRGIEGGTENAVYTMKYNLVTYSPLAISK